MKNWSPDRCGEGTKREEMRGLSWKMRERKRKEGLNRKRKRGIKKYTKKRDNKKETKKEKKKQRE